MGPTDLGSAPRANVSTPTVTHQISHPRKSANSTTWTSMRPAPQQTTNETAAAEDAAEEQAEDVTAAVDTPAEAVNNPDPKHLEQRHQHHRGDATVASAWSPGPTRRTRTTTTSTTMKIHPD